MERAMRAIVLLFVMLMLTCGAPKAGSLEETFAQAQTAFKSGDYDRAGQLFAQAGDILAKKQDFAKAGLLWGNAAVSHMKGENYTAASSLYELILSKNKRLPEKQALQVYKNLVLCRAKLGQRALQITAIDRMLKAIPKLPPAELADVYARQGDAYRHLELYGPAAVSYDKAAYILPKTTPGPQRAKILTALGLCQGQLGDYTKASKNLVEAHKLAEQEGVPQTVAESLSNLGILHWEQGDYPEAMELLNAALDLEIKQNLRLNEGNDRNNLGLVEKSVGNHQKAVEQIEKALLLAREVKDVRCEANATVNKALLHRLVGQLMEARAEYSAAMKLFEQCGHKEGIAATHLGIGKMTELEDKNYTLALEHYAKALEIFQELALPRWQASTYIQLGGLYKRISEPGRSTRDLVFDDSPTVPEISNADALAKSREYFALALELGKQLMGKEIIWPAHQGLGFAEFKAGNLEAAMDHYQKAIDIVTSMYLSLEAVEMLGEYMADKEDLYSEAQEVCVALYDKTKDKKYLDLQIKFSETLRNEIQKASTALVQMQYEDKDKQALYEELNKLGREHAKAAKAIPVAAKLPEDASPEQKMQKSLTDKAVKEQSVKVAKLEGDYKKSLEQWKKKYPEDAVVFESNSRINIESLQKNINDTTVILHYTSLNKFLLIIAISKEGYETYTVQVEKKEIDNLIKNKFLVEYIESGYGRKETFKQGEELQDLRNVCETLQKLYTILISPVEKELHGKNRIYIVSDGFLAQTPFGALVSEWENDQPNFLIEKYDIGYVRPSFIDSLSKEVKDGKVKKLLAIANPKNNNFVMAPLVGTVYEIKEANNYLSSSNIDKNIAFTTNLSTDSSTKDKNNMSEEAILKSFPGISYPPDAPTEQWFRDKIDNNDYEILYLATHGMPYSNTFSLNKQIINAKNKKKKIREDYEKIYKMTENSLNKNSPLNGFLLLSNEKDDNILKSSISTQKDGLLTMKEIAQLQSSKFKNTKYVILSACNTGVTFAPISLKHDDDKSIFNKENIEKDLRNQGFLPGVDQVSFVETFMRKGIQNVYGTLWFADDKISSILMTKFLKKLVEQGDKPDAVAAYSHAQRSIVIAGKKQEHVADGYNYPQHPYLWAVGAIFGK